MQTITSQWGKIISEEEFLILYAYFFKIQSFCFDTIPLLICTLILKNQVGKIKVHELDFQPAKNQLQN